MKLRKIKKGEVSQATIIWIMIIVVVSIAIIFIMRFDLKTIMGNLPGKNTNPEEEPDEVIEGVDLPSFFDCKYPIGYIPIESGRRTIYLLDLKDIKETELKEIGNQLSKAKKKEYLQLTIDGDVLYSERRGKWWNLWLWKTEAELAEKENEVKNGKPTGESTIKFNQKLTQFISYSIESTLPGIKDLSTGIESLRNDLQILYNARYISNPGWICGDQRVIESLKTSNECKESCEIYGGECKKSKDVNEVEIQGIDCGSGKKCFVKTGKKVTSSELKLKDLSMQFEYGTSSVLDKDRVTLLNSLHGPIMTNIMYSLEGKGFCHFLRTENYASVKKYSAESTYIETGQIVYSLGKELSGLLLFAAYPISNHSDNIFKNTKIGIRYNEIETDYGDYQYYGTPSRD